MATQLDAPRTRRRLLLGGLSGVAALVAHGLGRPDQANAGVDGDVVLGAVNTAATTTKVRNPTTGLPALWGAGASADGVLGTSTSRIGVEGISTSLIGVSGHCDSGVGVRASSINGNGVEALSSSGTGLFASSFDGLPIRASTPEGEAAIYALNENREVNYPAILGVTNHGGPGVMGVGGNDEDATRVGATGPAQTGVYGVFTSGFVGSPAPASTGVHGRSDAGRGVYGQSVTGTGVLGSAATGTAIRGSTGSGTAGAFYARSGFALGTSGRLRFAKASGVAAIGPGKSSVTLTPGFDVTPSSFVLLTPKADLGTRRLWYTTNTTSNTFTIKLSSAASATVQIGWLLLG